MKTLPIIFILLLLLPFVHATALTGINENSTFDTNVLAIDAVNNRVGILTTTPANALDVAGTINATQYINVTTDACITGGNCISTAGGTNIWTNTSGNLTIINARVGIGTSNPDNFTLQVAGDIGPETNATYDLGYSEGTADTPWALNTNLSGELSFYGESGSDQAGLFVSSAGDVNNDTYDDILVAAENTANGTVYLILGSADGWSGSINLSQANASWHGEVSADDLGRSAVGVGDVNGDGYDDIAFGAPGNDETASFAGQAYLVFGRANGWSMDNHIGTTANASWLGEAGADIAGDSIAGVGDVNNDSYDDFVIGAYGWTAGDNQGQAYLVLGRSSGWTMDYNLGTGTNASWVGELSAERFGTFVSGAGDFNGDGFDDILIAAERAADGGPFAGEMYLIYGHDGTWSMDQAIDSTNNASWYGQTDGGGDGISMNMDSGDVNGDTYSDIVLGMSRNNQIGSTAGKVYLLYGGQGGWGVDTNLSQANASWTGAAAGDELGIRVAVLPDVDEDGTGEILIGASGNDLSGAGTGRAYLLYGSNYASWTTDTNISLNASVSWYGEADNDQAGESVSSAGDFNGDGKIDLLIGANGNDEGGNSAGKAYVIFSPNTNVTNNIFSSVQTNIANISANVSIGDSLYLYPNSINSSSTITLDANTVYFSGTTNVSLNILSTGYVNATTDVCITGGNCISTTTANPWTNTSNNLTFATGNVGIGTSTPSFALEVNGSIGPNATNSYSVGGIVPFGMYNNVSNVANKEWFGERNDSKAGWDAVVVGDVNGDGYQDIVISAYSDDEAGTNTGQVYLILGPISDWASSNNLSSANASWQGEAPGDLLGQRIMTGKDVNADGYDDIIMSAGNNDEGGSNAGQVYLILGKSTGWTMDNNISTTANASWQGESTNDELGSNDLAMGDVNGDGYDDILIGAGEANAYFSEAFDGEGKVYLIFGKASGWSLDNNISTTANASWFAESTSDTLGRGVAIGDLNGDGYNDIIMSATGYDDAATNDGAVFVVFGKTSGWSKGTNISISANARFYGESAGEFLGAFITMAGDVNADGYNDLLIGNSENDETGTDTGQVYLILGQAQAWNTTNNVSTVASASWHGEAPGDYAGTRMARIGDINNDGYDDILIGAGEANGSGTDAGKVYLVLGKANQWTMDNNLSTTDASWYAEAEGDRFDASLGTTGDLNADGYIDLLFGASRNDQGATDIGKVYLILTNPQQFNNTYTNDATASNSLSVGTKLKIANNKIQSDTSIIINATTVNIQNKIKTLGGGTIQDNATCTIVKNPNGDIGLEVCDV